MANTKTVLIIGGSGFLGSRLALKLRDSYKIFATYHTHPLKIPGVTFLPFNVDSRDWVKRVVSVAQPDILIYAAGHHSREWAEANPRDAERLHANGTATLINTAEIIQPRVIYFSSSYIFDGFRGNYHETDTALPGSTLGKVSLSGENVVRAKAFNYIILRSSPIFGRSCGKNFSFFDRLRMGLERKTRMEISSNEFHSFAPIESLCELTYRLIESGLRNRILHYGGLTKITYFEFAKNFAKRFNYDPSLILPKGSSLKKKTGSENFTFDFSLNSTQVIESLKIKPLLLEESFDLIEKQLVSHS